MSKNSNPSSKNGRLVIRGVRRKQPDISKISRAIIGLALREAALEAEAQRTATAANTDAERSRGDGKPREPRV